MRSRVLPLYRALVAVLAVLVALLTPVDLGRAADEPAAGDLPIPLQEWREMTAGRTVYYYIDGTFFGREYYWPGRDMVTFQHASGQCTDARWEFDAGIYCFFFDRAHCFSHVRRGDRIMIIPQSVPDGGLGSEQEVRQIVTMPFSCAPGLSS